MEVKLQVFLTLAVVSGQLHTLGALSSREQALVPTG